MHAVIFDIDGTLLESVQVDDDLYRQAVREVHGDIVLRSSLHDYEDVSDSGILRDIARDNALEMRLEADVKACFVELLRQHVDEYGPFQQIAGAAELLTSLSRSARHGVAMATGGWRESAALKLSSSGIEFADVPLATSDDAVRRTDIMQIALDRLGAGFTRISYYGDGVWDRAACTELGWHFIAVGPGLNGLTSYVAHKVDDRHS